MKGVYVRTIIFGIADSLVSTVGLLAGIDASGVAHKTVILTGVIYAFVESLSMAVGSLLSEQAGEEFQRKSERISKTPIVASVFMFVSFLAASSIPILPYVFTEANSAFWVSIGLSLATLFVVGTVMAKISRVRLFRHGIRMVLLGGGAILVGVLVGHYFHLS
jgi:VIT1/CCC1 family predicted Fe2+/Mn2+ transporter